MVQTNLRTEFDKQPPWDELELWFQNDRLDVNDFTLLRADLVASKRENYQGHGEYQKGHTSKCLFHLQSLS
jgi:hypothetical protein